MSGVFLEGESSEDSSSSDDSSFNESGEEESKEEASAGDNVSDFSRENEDTDVTLEDSSLNRTVTNGEISLGDTQTILDRFLSVGSGPGLQQAGDRTGKFNLQLIIYNLQFTGESDNERIE